MLSHIVSKKILLIAEDTINCIPYIKKRVTKLLIDNNDDNNTRSWAFKTNYN